MTQHQHNVCDTNSDYEARLSQIISIEHVQSRAVSHTRPTDTNYNRHVSQQNAIAIHARVWLTASARSCGRSRNPIELH